jgi:hypothetical protein
MKYSNKRNYRDQVLVEEEIVTKKVVIKKKEKGIIANLFNKLTKNNK